jgi:hypothetical protein
MEKLLKLDGIVEMDIPQAIYEYGLSNYPELYLDYECKTALNCDDPIAVSELSEKKAIMLSQEYPGGYGIQFQNAREISVFGQFVNAVLSKVIAEIEKPIRDENSDPETILNALKYASELRSTKRNIQPLLEVIGNGIRNKFKKGSYCRIASNDGNVKIWVSKNPITADNGGEYLGEYPNSSDTDFDICGEIRGLQGVVNAIPSTHYAFFHKEDNDLYLWESFFSNGKERFNENEFGRLLK